MIIFMTEGTEFTGLADRIRCIVSAYAVAKLTGFPSTYIMTKALN
jgi:hypothetical protein